MFYVLTMRKRFVVGWLRCEVERLGGGCCNNFTRRIEWLERGGILVCVGDTLFVFCLEV